MDPDTEAPVAVQEPPRKSFGQSLAESIKPFEDELTSKIAKPGRQPIEKPDAKPDSKPEAAKSEPKIEAKADPDEEIISGKRNPKSDDFKRVKTAAAEAARQRDEIKSKAETFEKELNELKKAPKHNAELISKIEKERDEYKTKYDQVALAYDPEFNASYKSRVDSVIETVKKLVPSDRAEDLAVVLQMPESDRKRKALVELTEDLDQFTINDIGQAKRDVQTILNERSSRIAKSETELAALAKKRSEDLESFKSNRSKVFDSVLEKAMKENPVFLKKEGDTAEVKAWNQSVEERSQSAKRLFMGEVEGDDTRAEAALWAAAAPGFLGELKSVQAENVQLKETLAKLQSASPGIGSGNVTIKSDKIESGSFARKVAQTMSGG